MSTEEHKKNAPKRISIAIITVSTTRTLLNDKSGNWISDQSKQEGHDVVFHKVISDDPEIIESKVRNLVQKEKPQVILMTGGTGIAPLRPAFPKSR